MKRPEAAGGHVITQQVRVRQVCVHDATVRKLSEPQSKTDTYRTPGEVTREERKERQRRDKKRERKH